MYWSGVQVFYKCIHGSLMSWILYTNPLLKMKPIIAGQITHQISQCIEPDII
jgi:hypothetical protein